MPVSMHDVAHLAGVSQRTVSNVVNDYVHVKPETRARVQAAIEELKYRPNLSARNLRGGRSGLIALAVPDISAPYFAELAKQVQHHAERHGLTLLVDQTGGSRERELKVLEGYRSAVIDGLILSPEAITGDDLANHDGSIPTVLLGERLEPGPFVHVSVDNIAAAKLATEHLISLGRTAIAAIGVLSEEGGLGPEVRRLQGYRRAMSEAGLSTEGLEISTSEWTRQEGYRAAKALLGGPARVDAFFCFNDVLAIGAIKACNDSGAHVPRDVAIVGWDDIEDAPFLSPALTTIAPDKEAIAATAVERLIEHMATTSPSEVEIVSAFTLVVRQSTGAATAAPLLLRD